MAKAQKNKQVLIFFSLLAFFLIILLYKIAILFSSDNGSKSATEKLYHTPLPTKAINENNQTNTFDTNISNSIRIEVITYTVQQRDTINSVAKKFGISTQTIMWVNNLNSQILAAGQKLEILPITGIAHKVVAGDTVNSLATKYHTDKQKIIDFPGNNFSNPETHSLIVGETLIIPDGSM
ncbi:MAG TPA: LysM peptidoglycan-binding domain-containing protein [Candidatus Saccharimonadales bacterium]|nr:LysM peptidoglycan-binding domain-containing protein [Candidatus Saccharimonadales bacterium]